MAHYKSKKGKRGEDDFSVDSILERAAESRNGSEHDPRASSSIDAWENRRQRIRAPHALTLDELQGGRPAPQEPTSQEPAPPAADDTPRQPVAEIPMQSPRPAHSLYERMMQARSHPDSVTQEEADLALKAFAAALPTEKEAADQPAQSLRAKTRQFTQQQTQSPDRAPHRISSLDVGSVDDIIRRFEEKAHSRAVDLYGEAAEEPAPPAKSSPARKADPAPALFDWEKDEKENRNLPRYGPEADVQPLPTRRDRPVFKVQSSPPAAAPDAQLSQPTGDGASPAADRDIARPEPEAPSADRPKEPENIPTVRVAAVRKVRRFSTPAKGEEALASRQDARPLTVEIRSLDQQDEQPIMTTDPASGAPALTFPEPAAKKDPAESVRAAATQFSLADGGLTGADQVYKKKAAAPAFREISSEEELSSFSDPSLRPQASKTPSDAGENVQDFLAPPSRKKGAAAVAAVADNAPDDTVPFTPPAAAAGKEEKRKVVLFGGAEEDNAPEEMPPETAYEEPEELEDYETTADADSVRLDLRARSRRLKARFIPTLLITLALFLLASPLLDAFKAANLTVYLIVQIVLVCLAGLINLNTMKGLGSLLRFRPDMDTPAALAVLGVLAHSVVMLATGNAADAPQLGGLAAMALLFNGIGKMTLLTRIRRNFRLVADDKEKRAVFLLDDPAVTAPLADGSVIGEALICTSRKTIHPQNFLRHSYCADPYEKVTCKLALAALIAALAGGVIAGVTVGLPTGVNLFAALLCLASPPASLLLSNLPLKMAAKRLNAEGAMLTGYQAVEDFSYANAITLSADELFPAGTVKLFNMHLLSANPLDEAILQAAAVARQAHSPIYHIFRQMLDSDNGLPKVDSVNYEERMGLSGWLGRTRVLIGNRALMEAHHIKVPPADVDKKILRGGGFPVYLAVDGQPSCLFVVGYEADEEIAYQLQRLSATGVTLLIDSSDPNLSAGMICDYFGLYGESVQMIAAAASPLLEQATTPRLKADAPALCRGSAGGYASILTAAIRIKSAISASTAIHIAGICLGAALAVYFSFAGLGSLLSALPLAAYQLVCTLITCIVPLIHKP